jgi:hypothetical protein
MTGPAARIPLPALLGAVALAASAASFTACSIVAAVDAAGPGGSDVVNPHDAGASDGTAVDSGAPEAAVDGTAASPYQGNPLCRASTSMGCYPDNPVSSMTANACGPSAAMVDSGTMLACHVQPGAQGPLPVCSAAGSGTSGSMCSASTDCASGFECVAHPGSGTGECRHYCCGGQSRCSSGDDGGSSEFCDIQSAVPSQTRVPVCMAVRSCALLNDQGPDAQANCAAPGTGTCCGQGETCSIVSDNGTTSCVAAGTVPVGGGCDTDDCAADLVCLGPPGQRSCYQLCLVMASASACPNGQMCKGGWPLFQKDSRAGICQ